MNAIASDEVTLAIFLGLFGIVWIIGLVAAMLDHDAKIDEARDIHNRVVDALLKRSEREGK